MLQLKRKPNFSSHHKRGPVSPIESRVEARGSCYKEGHCLPPQLERSLDSPAVTPGNPTLPLQVEWRLDFPEVTREDSCAPRGNWREIPRLPQQLEQNHVIPPSMRVEALVFLQRLESDPEFPLRTQEEV